MFINVYVCSYCQIPFKNNSQKTYNQMMESVEMTYSSEMSWFLVLHLKIVHSRKLQFAPCIKILQTKGNGFTFFATKSEKYLKRSTLLECV